MQLVVGERIGEPGRDVYVVGDCLSTNGLTTIHGARKVFYNYRYDEREFYEAAEDEWIEVRIRSLANAGSDDAAAASQGALLLRYEAQSVLGRLPGWFPEPIDWLEHRGQPLSVMSVPRGRPLREWRRTPTGISPLIPQIMAELLNLLEALHRNGQVVGCLGPDDILVDETSRICCTATDRVLSAKQAASQPRVFAPSFYPQAFAAPEVLNGNAAFDRRSDLYGWAALFVYLMTGDQEGRGHVRDTMLEFDAALEEVARISPNALRALSPKTDRRRIGEIVEGWSKAVKRALTTDPRRRPGTVDALRRVAMPARAFSVIRRLFRRSPRAG